MCNTDFSNSSSSNIYASLTGFDLAQHIIIGIIVGVMTLMLQSICSPNRAVSFYARAVSGAFSPAGLLMILLYAAIYILEMYILCHIKSLF